MSEAETQTAQLTIDDPVDAETLGRFGEFQAGRLQASERLADLELEKVRLLRTITTLDTERQRLFETLLMSRGLPPNTAVEIDANTGKMRVLQQG